VSATIGLSLRVEDPLVLTLLVLVFSGGATHAGLTAGMHGFLHGLGRWPAAHWTKSRSLIKKTPNERPTLY